MINETKLWNMLNDLDDHLWNLIGDEKLAIAIQAVMADLDTNNTPETCQDDGWIPWRGGEQPVPDGTVVDVRYYNGEQDQSMMAGKLRWSLSSSEYDIVAYRVVNHEVPPIPEGVPVWVMRDDGWRSIRVSDGNGGVYEAAYDRGKSWENPGTMRPVCFEPWDEVSAGVTYMELWNDCGVWGSEWRYDENPEPGHYFEARPEANNG